MQGLGMWRTDRLVAARSLSSVARGLGTLQLGIVACVLSCSVACGVLGPRPLQGGFFTTGPPGSPIHLVF